ncbi:hypothetical protein [Leptolyngbya sp. PCC 6406]|uniref:hypothetical protein n=1 Tax=Leptolyngbya sp. PCC 6406 TaxID=1173264 RepID=UPI0002ACFE34|nr:hypothetical protein [Leptolyngbya sp. PCC 6406]
MRYLAKVDKASFLGGATLQLLAQQIEGYMWERLAEPQRLETDSPIGFSEATLVLLRLNPDDMTVQAVEDALPWVLELIDTFLARGITPDFLEKEVERAEQWRQSLTLESQEVDRRSLEAAARRDEIQELEKSLKVERADLERREAELQGPREGQED